MLKFFLKHSIFLFLHLNTGCESKNSIPPSIQDVEISVSKSSDCKVGGSLYTRDSKVSNIVIFIPGSGAYK